MVSSDEINEEITDRVSTLMVNLDSLAGELPEVSARIDYLLLITSSLSYRLLLFKLNTNMSSHSESQDNNDNKHFEEEAVTEVKSLLCSMVDRASLELYLEREDKKLEGFNADS